MTAVVGESGGIPTIESTGPPTERVVDSEVAASVSERSSEVLAVRISAMPNL